MYSKLEIKHSESIKGSFIIRYYLVILSFILSCIYAWYTRVLGPLNNAININYVLAITILLSFDFKKIDKSKIFLIISLLICGILIRRWLVLWTIIALVYQIDYYKINLRRLAFISIVVLSCELLIQLESVLFGILQENVIVVEKTGRMAHDLGIGNSNRLGLIIFDWCNMLYLYMAVKKGSRFTFVLISILLSSIMFYYTSCRTAYMGIWILILVAYMYWKNLIPQSTKTIVGLFPLIVFLLHLYVFSNYSDLGDLNEASTGRLWYITKYITNFSESEWLIGGIIESDDPLDGSYLEMILKGGIVLSTLFCVTFFVSCVKCFDKIKKYLPVVISTLLAGIPETIFTTPSPSAVILWAIILYYFFPNKPVYK